LNYLVNTSSLYSLLLDLPFNPCLFTTYHFNKPSMTKRISCSNNSIINWDASSYINNSAYMLNDWSLDALNCRLCSYILDINLSKSAAYTFSQLFGVGTERSKLSVWRMSFSKLTNCVSVIDSSGVFAKYSMLGGYISSILPAMYKHVAAISWICCSFNEHFSRCILWCIYLSKMFIPI
jgi:hypothetical protein